MTANAICNNCGKPVENTSGVLLHIRDGMEFVNETLPDKRRCFIFAALAIPEAQPTLGWISVKDLPEPLLDDFEGRFSATLQLFDSANNYWLGFYDFKDSKWWIHQGYEDDAEVMPLYQITDWQPLLSPPEPTPTKKD